MVNQLIKIVIYLRRLDISDYNNNSIPNSAYAYYNNDNLTAIETRIPLPVIDYGVIALLSVTSSFITFVRLY